MQQARTKHRASPSPAQAARTLGADVLAGTYLHSSAISDLGKAYANVPEKMAQVLESKLIRKMR